MYQEFIEALECLGLSGYEAKVYLALLKLGEATAQEISSESSIPYSKVHSILNILANKGLVEVILLRPKKYRLINPRKALTILASKLKERINSAKDMILSLALQYREQPRVMDLEFGIVQNREVLEVLATSLISSASKELLLSIPVDLALKVDYLLEELRRKHVHIALNAYSVDKMENLEKLFNLADEIRFCKSPNAFLIIKDFDEVVYSPKTRVKEREPYTGLHIVGDDLVYIFSSFYYYHIWAFSKIYKTIEYEFKSEWIRKYVHIWTLIDTLEKLQKQRYYITLLTKGYWVKLREPVSIEGRVREVTKNLEKGLHSIKVEAGSKLYKIGGYRASVEDIEGREFVVRAYLETRTHRDGGNR